MADDFVITGTRPPTATGIRPHTATSKDFGYYTKNTRSTVDETLFHSHHSSSLNAPVPFAAPWKKKRKGAVDIKEKPKPGRPLLWAPASSTTQFSSNFNRTFSKHDTDEDCDSSLLGTIQGVPLKHQYRQLKHIPTFVDESLFGKPLLEPSFKAPWEEKKKVQRYNWYRGEQEERKPMRKRRPATALGLHGYATSTSAVPIWKP